MAIDLLKYIIWRTATGGGGDPPVTDVTETSLAVNTDSGKLVWTKPANYKGTKFGISSDDLVATAPNGSDVEEMEMDEDGYVLVETDE